LTTGRLVIKRQAHPEKDKALAERLDATGARCMFEAHSPPAIRPAGKKPDPRGEIICPKCGHRQVQTDECHHCGIIFSKVKPRSQSVQLQASAQKTIEVPKPMPAIKATALALVWRAGLEKRRLFFEWLKGSTHTDSRIRRWSQRFGDVLSRLAVSLCITLLLEIILLFLGRYLWFIFSWTPIGQHYHEMAAEQALMLDHLFQANVFSQAGQATFAAVGALLFLSAIGRFTMVSRFLFDPFGFLGQTLFWMLPITLLTAWVGQWQGIWDYFAVAFGLLLIPTLCLAGRTMELAGMVVPEINMLGQIAAVAGEHRHQGTVWLKKTIVRLSDQLKGH